MPTNLRHPLALAIATLASLSLAARSDQPSLQPWDTRLVAAHDWRLKAIAVNAGQGAVALVTDYDRLAARTFDTDGNAEALRVLGSLGYSGASNFGDLAALGRGQYAASWQYDHHYAGFMGASLRAFGRTALGPTKSVPRGAPLLAGDGQGGTVALVPGRWPRGWGLRHYARTGRLLAEIPDVLRDLPLDIVGFRGGLIARTSSELIWIDPDGSIVERATHPWSDSAQIAANEGRLALAGFDARGGVAVRTGPSPRALGPVHRLVHPPRLARRPRIALDAGGRGLLVWSEAGQRFARRFDRDGSAWGRIVPLEPGPPGSLPSQEPEQEIAAGKDAEYAIAWQDALGVWIRRLPRAVPGDELCALRNDVLTCDTAHDGGREDDSRRIDFDRSEALLADVDGDHRDDLCGSERDRPGVIVCSTALAGEDGAVDLVFDLSALRAPGDRLVAADLDGIGRDAFCWVRGDLVLCDTGRDGGSAEVILRLDGPPGEVLFGDLDADGDDDPCVAGGGSLRCDLDHDGRTTDLVLDIRWVGAHSTLVLAAETATQRAAPCSFALLPAGWLWRCDRDHDGSPDVERLLTLGAPNAPATAIPLVGNTDGW